MRTFSSIVCLILGCFISTTALSQSLENYVRQTYLLPDKEYTLKPTNRFKALGKVSPHTVNRNDCNRIQGVLINNSDKNLKAIIEAYKYDVAYNTRFGEFVFFTLGKSHTIADGKTINIDNQLQPFLHGFALIRGDDLIFQENKISFEDPETGGYERSFWDVFVYKGNYYVLIFTRRFESHNFEIYLISHGGSPKVADFEFGGL